MKAAAKTKTPKPAKRKPARAVAVKGHAPAFREIIGLIQSARQRAFQAVNTELIGLYWRVGEYISHRINSDGWGQATIVLLAGYIQRQQPELRGFSAQTPRGFPGAIIYLGVSAIAMIFLFGQCLFDCVAFFPQRDYSAAQWP